MVRESCFWTCLIWHVSALLLRLVHLPLFGVHHSDYWGVREGTLRYRGATLHAAPTILCVFLSKVITSMDGLSPGKTREPQITCAPCQWLLGPCVLWFFPSWDKASLMTQMVKRLSAVWKTRFDPWVGKIPWRRKWQPTPVFLPGKSHGQQSLAGYSPWGRKE